MSITQELSDLKLQIERAKKDEAEAQGAQKQLLKQLKDEYGCKDLEAARKRFESLKTEIEELDTEIAEALEAVKEEYGL